MANESPEPESSADPLVGRTWAGRYLIRALVARGSMGRVYQAEQQPLGRTVALKVLDVSGLGGDGSAGERHEQRFLREASTLAQLNHPNTVRVFDFGVEGKDSYLVMEFVSGRTLRGVMGNNLALAPLRSVRIARQICGSLQEAHEVGVVHRDLKPANILISPSADDGEMVKVVDFGLVKEMDDALHMTGEGILVGTPMFMAPEQIRGKDIDGRCDVYALGVVLYRMVTGKYPFEQGPQAAILMAHLTEAPIPFARAAAGAQLSPRLETVVMRCLAKEPKDRFLNAKELQRALKLLEAELLDDGSLISPWSVVEGRVIVFGNGARPAPAISWSVTAVVALVALVASVAALLVAGLGTAVYLARPAPEPAVMAPAPPLPAAVPVVAEPLVEPEPALSAPSVSPEPAPPAAPARALPRKGVPAPPPAPVPAPALAPTPKPASGSDLRDPWGG